MWFFKLLGVAALVCSGMATSYELNRRASAALQQNEAMMALIRTVRGQIECFARPISEILSTCAESDLVACGYLYSDVPSDLSEFAGKCISYDEETMQIVLRFAEEFGRGYREDEVRGCDYVLTLLDERRACLAAEIPVKKKRNCVLAVCAALAMAIFLL